MNVLGDRLICRDLNLERIQADICEALNKGIDFKRRKVKTRSITSHEEAFFGTVLGQDARQIATENFVGANNGDGAWADSHIRVNDIGLEESYKSGIGNFFYCSNEAIGLEKEVRRGLNIVFDSAKDLLIEMLNNTCPEFRSLEHNERTGGIFRGLQWNVNRYCAADRPVLHTDDMTSSLATFYPASVTVAFFSADHPSEFLLKHPDGRQEVGRGNGVLFGLCGKSYSAATHRAIINWSDIKYPKARRISINFRIVRKELYDFINNAREWNKRLGV